MRYFYQYNPDGRILARVTGVTAPDCVRQFERANLLPVGVKKYSTRDKTITIFRSVDLGGGEFRLEREGVINLT